MQNFNITNKDFLNPKSLEREFGISQSKQAKLRMRKFHNKPDSLPFVRIGKTILYKRTEILAWLDRMAFNAEVKNVES